MKRPPMLDWVQVDNQGALSWIGACPKFGPLYRLVLEKVPFCGFAQIKVFHANTGELLDFDDRIFPSMYPSWAAAVDELVARTKCKADERYRKWLRNRRIVLWGALALLLGLTTAGVLYTLTLPVH